MTRLKLTLCSVMRVSALEGIQDKEIAKLTPTGHPGERNGRFVEFFKINLLLSNAHQLLPFLDCNLVPRVLLVNEETLGTRLNRLIVEIKSVNFALVFQVFFYCDFDVGKTQSFKPAICTLPKVCLLHFLVYLMGWKRQGMVCENPGSNNRKVLRL